MDTDIIIVGAGMVGSTLALALKDCAVSVTVLDASPLTLKEFTPDTAFEPRVSALSFASQTILDNLGAWQGILQRRASPYDFMHVWDGDGTGVIDFSAHSVHAEHLGHIVENAVVQDALIEQLHNTQIQLISNARVENARRSGKGWLVQLADGQEITGRLLVAADGANSVIRRLTGCETREWDYGHHAVVTSIRTEQPHQKTAWQRFTNTGPIALLPLTHVNDGEHWCSIVWSTSPEEAQRLVELDEATFCAELTSAFESKLGKVEHSDTRFNILLRQRHAKRYIEQGLAFIGDAAHTIHPLAGQGVNLGMLDAATLAEVLLHALDRQENFASEQVLSRFERRRMPANLAMMAAMESFKRLFQADALPLRWLRNTGLNLMQQSAEAKALFVRQALGVSGDIPKLAKVVKVT
ncbi:2-octaprenyl-3-methyl-6-methoxy-1,4-benzoquinol hydroxylase [Pseudomonas sp. F1_0610]|uniref:2-octaprenyl-3-methyl-6-methoxy-1,4-benzoquinol hydroxylase n=1 Tax=Pseudomonas sp. F1_0610 TaxID=3114284 RepID=UPI0039C32CAD